MSSTLAATQEPFKKRKLEEETIVPTSTSKPAPTAPVRRATIYRLVHEGAREFCFDTHVHFKDLVRSKMASIIPLALVGDRPVLVQLNGGGRIPSFGLDQKEDKPNKYNVIINVECDQEHESLVQVREELTGCTLRMWDKWFPDQKRPSDELLREQCNTLISKRTPKQNSDSFWPGMFKSGVDRADVETGRCKLVDEDGKSLQLEDLPGMRWKKAIVEFRSMYILSNRSYGITRRLRYLECADGVPQEVIIPL